MTKAIRSIKKSVAAPVSTSFADLLARFWEWTAQRPIPLFLFRGQGEDIPIRPKIGRPDYKYERSRERQMFAAFKQRARPFVAQKPENDWEWLALAQHHGAPTRLTDWSTNPLVACWFAVTSYPFDKDAVVLALDTTRTDLRTVDTRNDKVSDGTTVADPLEPLTNVFLLETSPISPRISTQRGIFTAHGAPDADFEIPINEKFFIPHALRGEMQGQLLDFGVDASHIFPDLDGLCRTFDWRFRSGKGFSAVS